MTRTHKWYILDKTHSDYDSINTAIQSSMTDVPNNVSVRDNDDNTKQLVKIDVTQSWLDSQSWQSSPAIIVEHTGNNTGLQAELDTNNFVEYEPVMPYTAENFLG